MRMKEWMQLDNNRWVPDTDPYCNGLIYTRLIDRYEDELDDEDYPQINSLLSYSYCLSDLDEEKLGSSSIDRGIYQHNGFYIYEVI